MHLAHRLPRSRSCAPTCLAGRSLLTLRKPSRGRWPVPPEAGAVLKPPFPAPAWADVFLFPKDPLSAGDGAVQGLREDWPKEGVFTRTQPGCGDCEGSCQSITKQLHPQKSRGARTCTSTQGPQGRSLALGGQGGGCQDYGRRHRTATGPAPVACWQCHTGGWRKQDWHRLSVRG